jgi:hypothetical protein
MSSIRKFCKGGEVNSPLLDLYHQPLALVLVTLIGILPLIRFPGPRTVSDEVIRTPAIETAISAASLLDLLNIWPWARLLWLLRRYGRSIPSLLLRWPENQSAKRSIPLWCSRWCILNKSIPRGLNARGSSGNPSLLFGTVCRDAILLGRAILISSLKVFAFIRFRCSLSLVLKPRQKRSCFLVSLSA